MVEETIRQFTARMNCLTDLEREKVMCALLNRYCVGCGRAGNWSEAPCDCEPLAAPPSEERTVEQLWLVYQEQRRKVA